MVYCIQTLRVLIEGYPVGTSGVFLRCFISVCKGTLTNRIVTAHVLALAPVQTYRDGFLRTGIGKSALVEVLSSVVILTSIGAPSIADNTHRA